MTRCRLAATVAFAVLAIAGVSTPIRNVGFCAK